MSTQRARTLIVIVLVAILLSLYLYNQVFVGTSPTSLPPLRSNPVKLFPTDTSASPDERTSLAIKSNESAVSQSIQVTEDNIKELIIRIEQTLRWASVQAPPAQLLAWDKVSIAELHILTKLLRYLKNLISNPSKIKELKSAQCSELQMRQQEVISKSVSMDICSEIEWYKLAQLTWPQAKLIVDVGGNKGYLGSLFLALWGGGGYLVNPRKLFDVSTSKKVWEGSKNPAGFCRDGFNHGIQLSCGVAGISVAGNSSSAWAAALGRDVKTGQCLGKREDVSVHSFDGSSYLQFTVDYIVTKVIESRDKRLEDRSAWKYHHMAMSNQAGTVRFTKQGPGQNAGFEGGKIRSVNNLDNTEVVNMSTVDQFLREHQLAGTLDILKIDAEGNDNKVIEGAVEALQASVGLLTFEGGGGVTFSKELSESLNSLGFTCFSTSRAGLFKWTNGCMADKYFGDFRKKDKGNIFCVSRVKAPMAALAFEALAFPILFEEHPFDPINTNISSISKQFVNIKRYCHPWPACVADYSSSGSF